MCNETQLGAVNSGILACALEKRNGQFRAVLSVMSAAKWHKELLVLLTDKGDLTN